MDTRTVTVPTTITDRTRWMLVAIGMVIVLIGLSVIAAGISHEPPLPCVHVTSYTDYNGPNPICQ
jgi:hypothetical protein